MATKAQEREALRKIMDIVEGLGDDSYLSIAFAGCFEDAEVNIDNDWAMSMKDRYEKALEKYNLIQNECNALRSKCSRMEENARICGELNEKLRDRDQTIARLEQEIESADRIEFGLTEQIRDLKVRIYDLLYPEA